MSQRLLNSLYENLVEEPKVEGVCVCGHKLYSHNQDPGDMDVGCDVAQCPCEEYQEGE